MIKHGIKLIYLPILIVVILFGCAKNDYLPEVLSSEQSIKEIIVSKGDSYDFLKDKQYMEYMDQLGSQLVTNKEALPPHYTIGNLDYDNIPELVVFKERDPDNTEDEGQLELYKFNGDKYDLTDSISMNYDNTNYQMLIGKISNDTNGLLLNNTVGAHSGTTHGFIIEDNKFKNIFNTNKISLLSIYPNSEIKDIDGDGILEFSIYTIDPETEENNIVEADKMTLWYRWDGKDSADLIKFERDNIGIEGLNVEESSLDKEAKIMEMEEELGEDSITLEYLIENKDLLPKSEFTILLQDYIKSLEGILFHKGIEIDYLFSKYEDGHDTGYLFEKYGLSIEKLNSIEYLNREKTLKDEIELKDILIHNLDLGFILDQNKNGYHYILNYQRFIDLFSEYIYNEYEDYLKILALNSNEEFLRDGNLLISMDKLAERILFTESFKMVYPYSELLGEVMEIDFLYKDVFFYGPVHSPNFHEETLKLKYEIKLAFENTIEKYSYTSFAEIVKSFYEDLKSNDFILNDDIAANLRDILQ